MLSTSHPGPAVTPVSGDGCDIVTRLPVLGWDLVVPEPNMSPEPKPARLAPRSVSASRTTITELMIPSYANFGGKIHGGILLSLMDKVAYACASRHAGTYCVTVSVDGVDFLRPVEVGDLVSLKASVNYVGRTSLVVGIRVEAENVERAEMRHTNTSYITMVARDEHGASTTVPRLILESDEDIRRFVTAAERRQVRARDREVMARYKDQFTIDDHAREVLAGERCVVAGND
jgi:uncharacterized protein (TIGR00369 family)